MIKKYLFNKKLFAFLGIILIGILVAQLDAWSNFNEGWIETHIRGKGMSGVWYFIGMFTLVSACGFPRQFTAFLGGYAFGFIEGTLIATFAATLGCFTSLLVAKFIARPFIYQRFEHRIKSMRTFLNKDTFTKTIIIRLLPIGSNLITNAVAGVTKIKILPFIAGSFLGYIPQMAIFSLAGTGIEVMSYTKIGLSVFLFLISAILTTRLYKNYKRKIPSDNNDMNAHQDDMTKKTLKNSAIKIQG